MVGVLDGRRLFVGHEVVWSAVSGRWELQVWRDFDGLDNHGRGASARRG
jgi:hypothetical protein